MVLLAAHFQPTQFAKTESGIPIFENKMFEGTLDFVEKFPSFRRDREQQQQQQM